MKKTKSLFGKHRAGLPAEMDMTPMVDVTFLLLIFFMVTASFAMQQSLEFPSSERQEKETAQSRTMEDIDSRDDYIVVRIDSDNVYHVEDHETYSRQELLAILRDMKDAKTVGLGVPLNLLIIADNSAKHETVVSAIDAGNVAGITRIKYTTVEE